MRRALLILSILAFFGCTQPRFELPNEPHPSTSFNRLLFAGDVMFSRAVRREMLASGDAALPFRKIAPLLADADIAFINLESPFSDTGPYHEGGLIFHAPPAAIAGLQLAGIDVASTANNHSRDCGSHGVEYTVQWLRSHGIVPVGSGLSPADVHAGEIIERNGIRFGFLAYTFDQSNGNWRDRDLRIAQADIEKMSQDVRALRNRTDVVIVSMHHGVEYMPRPSKAQIAFAHAAVEAGAGLVIGHHPHVIEPTEYYHGAVIFYSLGNFVFDQFQRVETQHGEIAEVDFLGKTILFQTAWPVKITLTGPELETRSQPPAARST